MSQHELLSSLFWVALLTLWVVCAGVGLAVSKRKAGFWLGLLLGPLGVVVAGLLGDEAPAVDYSRREHDGPGMR